MMAVVETTAISDMVWMMRVMRMMRMMWVVIVVMIIWIIAVPVPIRVVTAPVITGV